MIRPISATVAYSLASDWFVRTRSANAANAMARALICGHGCPPDIEVGVKVLQEQALVGDADSQVDLARCYFYGEGVPANLGACRLWLEQAARQDHALAIMELIQLLSSDPDAEPEILGLAIRLLQLQPGQADYLRDVLPAGLEDMSPEQIEEGFRRHGRPTLH